MLEGAVARVLNQLLGRYVVDLDTENLNVGIFSGLVQLTDLKLKTEALYELDLPIEVTAGTIGKISLQIPWTNLWNQSVVVNVEDVHIICAPVVTFKPFDEERNKRLIRAFKRRALTKLQDDGGIIGGPKSFTEHLVANMINNLEFSVNNIHVRYEDCVSTKGCVSAGFCIGSITAESTNSKWKSSREKNDPDTCYYLVKVDALSCYWNTNSNPSNWNLPSEYYSWRNAMSSSLQNYTMNGDSFNFLIKPMTVKLKMTINKFTSIVKVLSDLIVQDCHIQLSKDQYNSILEVCDSLKRMFISWNFLALRPQVPMMENRRVWWKYAYEAALEQKVRPYTWSRIKNTRRCFKAYVEVYKKILSNPNDTELKLDLQQHEDGLSLVNVVIARHYGRLLVNSSSLLEKNFWAVLPSPEKKLLCDKIGLAYDKDDNKQVIEHRFNVRVGNVSITLFKKEQEIAVLTLTQVNLFITPSPSTGCHRVQVKVEGLVVEGASAADHLVPIVTSEHLGHSPAYCFKYEFEKLEHRTTFTHKLNVCLSSIEVLYEKKAFDEIISFLENKNYSVNDLYAYIKKVPNQVHEFVEQKLKQNWDLNLDITVPFLVLPESSFTKKGETTMVMDFGRWIMRTELCQNCESTENFTYAEIEERVYSKLFVEHSNAQVLFCNSVDNWRDARKEKDTDLHLIPRSGFIAIFSTATKQVKNIPRHKYNVNIESFKINLSERKLWLLLKFLRNIEKMLSPAAIIKKVQPPWMVDVVKAKYKHSYLLEAQKALANPRKRVLLRRRKVEKGNRGGKEIDKKTETTDVRNDDMNEVWARVVDLPGLEDNISPNNKILDLICVNLIEFSLVFCRSSDSADRQYLMLRMGLFALDLAFMTFGPAYQISLNNILITDKLHTTTSGQYLDILHSPFPSTVDVLSILYRKVDASCPEFWSHFHGVETSLVADVGTLNFLLHQEAIHTMTKYYSYINNKSKNQISTTMTRRAVKYYEMLKNVLHNGPVETPVPPGAVKFSHSARIGGLNIKICDSDYDILNIHMTGFELDVLFRANERFVFRSFLSTMNVEHLSDVTLYPRVLYTNEDKVYEIKYVKLSNPSKIPKEMIYGHQKIILDGTLKFHLGQIHLTLLYKLFVQLQRFIINIEAVPFIRSCFQRFNEAALKLSDLMHSSTKIRTAINICGPILLFPQKSSSPNVIIFDTGEMIVENFFKEYSDETVENILFKLEGVTVSRGVMTLTNSIEMQEVIVESFNMGIDVKRFIYANPASNTLIWDLDALVDPIHITLGQRDVCIMCSIYKDNMGEGDIVDIFPGEEVAQKSTEPSELAIRALEQFFGAKQKSIIARIELEAVKLSLYFDSGEVLSSPVRDLNHGLCTFELVDILTSLSIYKDKSLVGKLSIDNVSIEEIGPNANVLEKKILIAPQDPSSNYNCNITVNKPPIVDINFHQNNPDDKADIFLGKLTLTLSVPFCEKITMFVLECIPKDNIDSGIVNLGYVKDVPSSDNKPPYKDLSVSIRINQPEFIFLIETASHKRRYFITRCEVFLDYTIYSNKISSTIALSGLHTIFCDFSITSRDPYLVLKHCQIELCQTISTEEGNKINVIVSPIYIQIYNNVINTLTDVLNDIAEHFKVPEIQQTLSRKTKDKSNTNVPETEDLWEPKKLIECVPKCNEDYVEKDTEQVTMSETLIVLCIDMVLIMELQEIPVLCFKATAQVSLYNWSHMLNCTSEFTLQANYYNEGLQTWEPFLEPVVVDDNDYRPWDFVLKIFQDKSLPMLQITDRKVKKESGKKRKCSHSSTATENEDSGEDMLYLEPANLYSSRNNNRVKTSLSAFLDDSDSETEDYTMEKLATAISDLFTGDWNESEESESESSSDSNDESEANKNKSGKKPYIRNYPKKYEKSTYIIITGSERLDFTITPTFVKVVSDLCTEYSSKSLSVICDRDNIKLVNDIGPNSTIELYENSGDAKKKTLICTKTYEKQDSPPNSPTRYLYEDDPNNFYNVEDLHEIEFEWQRDECEAVNSLKFSAVTTPQLYEKVNKHVLKMHIEGFSRFQTNCSNRNWEKLIKIQSQDTAQFYHLAARHTVGKDGRSVVVSSPLQIQNETCFALSILYQPSVLQQLNLEPVGDVTNPFETTMRIAIVQPHEKYNVPLYIAHHCKLFIQPAYAEGQYICQSGIWWQDLLTEQDSTHNLQCEPKPDSNVDIFSLRIKLQPNISQKNLHTHSIPNYIIHILPPLIFNNFLPYALELENSSLKLQTKVDPAEKVSIYCLDLARDIKVTLKMKYNGVMWSGTFNYTPQFEEKIVTLSTEDRNGVQVLVNVKAERETSCKIFFYSTHWIVNKTGLPLHFKASISNHIYETTEENIVLFSFKRHGKQTLNAKVYDSDWSNEFSLDCAETPGLIVCKHHERKRRYSMMLLVKLSEMCPKITKIVTFLPCFLVVNETTHFLRIMEHNEKTDLWMDLPPKECITLWPETTSMQMYVKYRDSKSHSQSFFISTIHRTVLRMDKGAAICVDVAGGKTSPFQVTFQDYKPGDAPVLIKNYCTDLFLKIQQQGQGQVTLVNPYNSLLYTWDDPLKPRMLVWNIYNNKSSGFLVDVLKDGYGEEKISLRSVNTGETIASSSEDSDSSDSAKTTLNKKVHRDKITIYWLCYRDGLQRTLVFTQEQRIAEHIIKVMFMEYCHIEWCISLVGLGLSIFTENNVEVEHVYCSISDSPAMWEVNIGHKWKILTLELASWIEDKYLLSYKTCQLKEYVHTDFEKMFMLKPFFAELRRTYAPGVYIHYRKSRNYDFLNFKVQSLQIDNKQPSASSSLVLYPLPAENIRAQNPFLNCTIFRSNYRNCSIYKLVKLNVSDFFLSVEDQLFIDLNKLLVNNCKLALERSALYRNDMAYLHSCLKKDDTKDFSWFVENLQVSPVSVQLKICKTNTHVDLDAINLKYFKFLDHMFPINISPYLQIGTVLLKVKPVELEEFKESIKSTLLRLWDHINIQFLQTYYSQVLGFQVLINPHAMEVIGNHENVLSDVEKSASIPFFAFRCMLGHISMSPAAVEHSISDIFSNQNLDNLHHIKKRGTYERYEVTMKDATISSRDFKMGVPLALEQLIAKGINGTSFCNGELFFRGVGKALFSLIKRQPDDKSNSVLVAVDALRRASILGEPVRIHQRLTRYYDRYLGLKPHSSYQSMGQYLLHTIANSRYSNDTYWAHSSLARNSNTLIIVSLEHVIRVNKTTIWGPWDIEWCLDLDDIVSIPKMSTNELVLNVRQNPGSFVLATGTLTISGDENMLNKLQGKLEQAIIMSMEEKAWPVE